MSKSSFALISVLVLSVASVAFFAPAATNANTQTNRLGFWLQEGDISNCTWQGGYQQCGAAHPAQLFFNSMFLTPPYPSSIEVMIFTILQARTNSQPCSSASAYISGSETFWGDLAQLSNSYPNIKLVYEIAFDPSNGGSGTYGLSCFNSMVQYFGQYSSVYGLGVEGEYTTTSAGLTNAEMQTAMSDVNAVGKTFVNYYIHGVSIPQGGYAIYHTNFPEAGDQVGTLRGGGPNTIGIDSGYYYSFPFPQTLITCPIGANVIVTGLVEGWNQCVVSTELSVAVSMPSSQRQFVELDPGFSSSGTFTGVSGQATDQLWDNPNLRNWIWTDPNYQPDFILATSSTPPPTTTTKMSSTTTASSSTAAASSPQPPSAGPQLVVLPTGVPYNPLKNQTLGYSITGGPPGLGYNVRIRTPSGGIQVIAAGTVDANGSAGGTLSYVFNVQNGFFSAKAFFANGASSNVVGIQVGPPTSTSTTTTYVFPSTSSAVTYAVSSSTVVTTASSQQTTARATSTSTTASLQTTSSTTTSKSEIGDHIPFPRHGRSPGGSVTPSNTTTSSSSGNNQLGQGSGFSSPTGTAMGFALGVTAGVALGLVIITFVGRGIGNFPWRTSDHQRGNEKEDSVMSGK